MAKNEAKSLTGKTILPMQERERVIKMYEPNPEIHRLQEENERLYRQQATLAKQIKLLEIKLKDCMENLKPFYKRGNKK